MYCIFNDKSNMQCCSDGHLTLNGREDRLELELKTSGIKSLMEEFKNA